MGSAVHGKLVKIISEKMLVAGLEHMTEKVNTTLLEVFHAKIMVAETQVEALYHNSNNI